jgi:hypothetical protein
MTSETRAGRGDATKLIRRDTSAYSPKYSRQQHHRFMAAPCAEPWTVENTWDWMDKTPTSTHDLSVWSSSSLGRWHPRSSVLLVLTRHSSPILNERWTRVINLSMLFLLCYDLTEFWGHEPCIGFFLRRFNTPDALICYAGSIEKLKLLGATYLHTSFASNSTPPWRRALPPWWCQPPPPQKLLFPQTSWLTLWVKSEW